MRLVPPSTVRFAPGDVRRFRTRHKCHYRGNILNMPVAAQCRVLNLRRRPLARGSGFRSVSDRTRLNIVDGDAPANLSDKPCANILIKALSWPRYAARPGVNHCPLADARTD